MLNLHVLAFFVGYYEIFVENVWRPRFKNEVQKFRSE
jgi:hypothetical protein